MLNRRFFVILTLIFGFFIFDFTLAGAHAADNVLDGKVKVGHYKNDNGFSLTLTKQKSGYRVVYKAPKNYKKWRTYTMMQKGKNSEYFSYEEGWAKESMYYKALPGAGWFLVK